MATPLMAVNAFPLEECKKSGGGYFNLTVVEKNQNWIGNGPVLSIGRRGGKDRSVVTGPPSRLEGKETRSRRESRANGFQTTRRCSQTITGDYGKGKTKSRGVE